MTAPETLVRPATAADRDRCALVLAAAFADDPVFRYLFPTGIPRGEARLRAFFALDFDRSQACAGTWTSEDGAAAAIWYPPGTWRPSLWYQVRYGPAYLRVFGRQALLGMRTETLMEKHHPQQPHWYLYFVGTEPTRQGTGIGTAVMRPVLETCDREGLPAYLEATCERNRTLYLRNGFVERGEPLRLPGAGPELYPMWRDPQ